MTLLGGLRSVTGPPPTPHGWLLRQCCAIAAVFALAGFPRNAPEQPSTAALCTLVLLFLILGLGFFFTFFLCLSYFFVYVFAWFILTCFHNFSAPCTCTNHTAGNWGLLNKKLTSDVTVKWGHCFILWHSTRIAWITRQIYCLKSLPLAQIQKKRNLSKLREG